MAGKTANAFVASDADGLGAVRAILPLDAAMEARFVAYVELVRKWQPVKNLVAPSTLPDIWRRHVADGAQAFAALPAAKRWLDLGSGAGFPGLVTAILLADVEGGAVTLVESNGRKAAFLQTVARELKLPARVVSERIESIPERFKETGDRFDAVSARALASLDRLLAYAEAWLTAGATGVFHKGQDFAAERRQAALSWSFDLIERQSRIEPDSRIVLVDHVRRLPTAGLPEQDARR
ncbi:Ribosomal RNA small subunit methyltransferase G [uncultured Pleomorphomonas sp.]|uniref:Ribosomal RNA small subunit methyltransferase G n=1 Tax=uncultured Pleomorphomonas sp. TaxID=442121 RepID=A0A212LK76_9HYPH|nr:16S rRNA (guanine(527)-N(7))-methyltransferase RsmG [uncultured Pleomorphomonas sp.]SCM77897.1 Ribosomal RNA small subunit methyltransferase G [uncultured Pleomorphomonas sp.]